MTKQLYSDSRWWDNPKPRTPVCCTCKHYIGVVDGHVSCKAFSKIPKDIRNDYVKETMDSSMNRRIQRMFRS